MIKTKSEFKNLKVGKTVYYINPYGMGHLIQDQCTMKEIVIDKINRRNKSLTYTVTNGVCIGLSQNVNWSNLESSPIIKLFISKQKALDYLNLVRKGFYADIVKKHHDSVKAFHHDLDEEDLDTFKNINKPR